MKTWKAKLKRGFSLFLAFTMCLSMLQLTVLAADESSGSSTANHTHHAEGWICTPYCSLPEHTHTDACYHMAENEEQARIPVTLPDEIEVNDGTSTEKDDFGNEYQPGEIVWADENGNPVEHPNLPPEGEGGEDEGFLVGPGGEDEGFLVPPGEDLDEGFLVPPGGDETTTDPTDPNKGSEGETTTDPTDPNKGGEGETTTDPADTEKGGEGETTTDPADTEKGGEDETTTDPADTEKGGEDETKTDSADSNEDGSEAGKPVGQLIEAGLPAGLMASQWRKLKSGGYVLIPTLKVPLSGTPEYQCGMEEHKHSDACAETEGGGWYCVPDTNITINVPENRKAEGRVDLLEGVTASPAYCGNWPVQIAVAAVTTADGETLEPEDGQWLEAEGGVVYTVDYVAYLDAAMTVSEDGEPDAGAPPEGILGEASGTVEGENAEGDAKVGDKVYEKLEEALAAVKDGETVTVLRNVDANIVSDGTSFTLDLNGHVLNSGVVGKNVVTIMNSTVTVKNGIITGGDRGDRTNQDGKGVLTNNANVTLENCEIKDNSGYGKKGTTPGYMGNQGGFGGGIYAYDGSLTLKDCIVSGNKSSAKGGGIYAENCAVTLTGTKVIDNTTGSGAPAGGGIQISGGSLDVDNSTISGNIASNGNGNAIALTGANVKVTIKNSELSASDTKTASLIYTNYGAGPIDIDLENVELVNKAGPNTSQAIYTNHTGTFTAKDCTFRDSNGGIQLLKATEMSFTDCQFLNNDATYSSAGAPVYVKSGSASFTNCTFTGNKGYNAGAIYNASKTGTVTIDGCLFTGNSAKNSTSAGAIYVSAGTTNVTNTVVKGNTTSGTNSSGPAGGISVNGSGTVFNMTSGAVYDNKSEKTNAHDIYVYSSAKVNILAASKMADGEKDFSSYAWSDLTRTVIKDELKQNGNWVATPAPEYAATIGETKYKTLDDAFKAAREQSRASGDNVTVDIVEGYIPLNTYYGVTKSTGKYSPKVTLNLNNTNIYGVGISNSFSIEAGSTLTLSGTGTLNKKIYMMGGTLNLDGNVVVSGGSLSFNQAPIYDNKTDSKVNINGNVDLVQIALYKGTVTVGENAHVKKLEALMTTSSGQILPTEFTVNGEVDELNLTQCSGKSTATLNGHIGSLMLKHGTEIYGSKTFPVTKAGPNFFVDDLNVYPALSSVSSYDKNTGLDSGGQVSIYALQNPEQKFDDLVLIHGGAKGLGNAVWTTSMNNKHTDGKDYKFLTAVTSDDAGNVVLRKTVVGGGNFVFVDGEKGSDSANGTTLNSPVKTFERAKKVLADSSAEVISVLGTVSVTGSENWAPDADKESVTLESFPTYTGTLVKVPSGASLTLSGVKIDGKGITRSAPLIENRGTLNIENGATITGGVNTVIYGPNNGQGIDGGAVYNTGTLNMTGGAITGNTARTGAGVFSKGTFNLSGGEISGNTGYGGRFAYSYGGSSKVNSAPAGGGVFLAGSSKMNMSGGTIAGNTSSVGGGISLGNETNAYTSYGGPKFTMTGGSIDSNSAGQGGGIFVQIDCKATITGGSITGNEATGSFSVATGISFLYGGGGIYVNGIDAKTKYGTLEMQSVAITGNTSNSNGAGISGCPSSNVDIKVIDGGVVAGNTVNGKPFDVRVFRGIVFGPGGSDHSGGAKFSLSKYMLGGELYNWTDYHTNKRIPMQDVFAVDVGEFLHDGAFDGYSAASSEVIANVASKCSVRISGNHSVQGGGGIGTNGDVNIGKDPNLNDFFSVTINKKWLDPDGKPLDAETLAELKGQVSTVYVDLFRRVKGSDDAWELVDSREIEPNSNDFWYTHRPFYNLLKVLDGKELEYKVVERLSLTGEWSEVNGGEIKIETPPIRVENAFGEVDASATVDVSGKDFFTVTVKKNWVGADGNPLNAETLAALKAQAKEVAIELFCRVVAEEQETGENWISYNLTTLPVEDDFWKNERTFSGLPKFDLEGNPLEYKIVEKAALNGSWSGPIKFETTLLCKDGVYTTETTSIIPEEAIKGIAPLRLCKPNADGIAIPLDSDDWANITEIEITLTKQNDPEFQKTKTWLNTTPDENADVETPGATLEKLNTRNVGVSVSRRDRAVLALYEGNDNTSSSLDAIEIQVNVNKETSVVTAEITGLPNAANEYSVTATCKGKYGITELVKSDTKTLQTFVDNFNAGAETLENKLNAPSLILEKKVVDCDGKLADKIFNFKIEVFAKDSKPEDDPIDASDIIPLKPIKNDDGTWSIKTEPITQIGKTKLKPGMKIKVTEIGAEKGWNVEWTVVNATSDPSGAIAVEKDSQNVETDQATVNYGENTVTFINSSYPYGRLVLTKTVKGNIPGDKTHPWTFEIELDTTNVYDGEGKPLSENAKQVALDNIEFNGASVTKEAPGTIKVSTTLQNGGSYTINKIPKGVVVSKVTEVKDKDFPEGIEVSYTNTLTNNNLEPHKNETLAKGVKSNSLGNLEIKDHDDTFNVAFTNERAALKVSKTVTGDGDKSKEFHFTVNLIAPKGTNLPETLMASINGVDIPPLKVDNGECEFTLKHGDTIRLIGIPVGTKYTVTEVEANQGGYTTKQNGETGTIEDKDGIPEAAFINDKPTPPPPPTTPDPDPDPDPENPPPPPPPTPETPVETPPTPLTELPDPNDPDSPEEVTVIEEDVPKTYVKVWDPEEDEYVYVPEDEVPLASRVPETGDDFGPWAVLCLTSAAGLAVLSMPKPKKKEETD